MKKKILFLIVIFALFSTTSALGISINIDGIRVPYTYDSGIPFTDSNNRTLVPLRITLERFGASVWWNQDINSASVQRGEILLEIPIGEKYILCNGQKLGIDTSAIIKDGRTYLPIRAVFEALGANVEWKSINDQVIVTSTDHTDKNIYENASFDSIDKNIYTDEYLNNLVNTTKCDVNVLGFRAKDNIRRKGLLKIEGKYFDMYYPNDDYGIRVAEFLSPHMDKVYMMLADIYGLQTKVEVHLIHEEDALLLREGDIRKREKVTFVWLEPNNDAGGNNLAEFVHEVNHNFFSEANGGATNTMWLNEANAKMIASLYTKYNYDGRIDQLSFYDDLSLRLIPYSSDYKNTLTLDKSNEILRVERAWDKSSGEKRVAQIYGLYVWSYIYNNYSFEEFESFLRNLGTGDVVVKLEELLNMNSYEITELINEGIY